MEEAYQDEKQRGHSETVSIADRQAAEGGKAEAEHAQSGRNGSSSNGNGSSGVANGVGKVSKSHFNLMTKAHHMLPAGQRDMQQVLEGRPRWTRVSQPR